MNSFQNRHCPFCGYPKVNVHKLQDDTLGVWCDNCLEGIPTFAMHRRASYSQAIRDYKYYISIRKFVKF